MVRPLGYVASHDLQEPLRKIAECPSFLGEAIVWANQADIVHASTVIRTAALHARELVDDLLTFSRAINNDLNCKSLTCELSNSRSRLIRIGQ